MARVRDVPCTQKYLLLVGQNNSKYETAIRYHHLTRIREHSNPDAETF